MINNSKEYIHEDDEDSPFLIKTQSYPCIYMIIQPQISAWHGVWKGFIYFILFYGYVRYPFHIGYIISELNSTKHNRVKIPINAHDEEAIEFTLDIIFCLDIIMNFFTSYQTDDGTWDLFLPRVIWNYMKGSMVLDLLATLPCILTD